MSKKRILVISQHYWPENFRIADICEGFTQNDVEVDVFCGLPNYPKGILFPGYSYFKPRKQQKDGVNIYRCGEILRKGNSSLRIFLNYVSFPITATFNLIRVLGKRYDAIFCYQTSPVLMAFPAIVRAKLTRTKLTTYVLDLWPENLYSVLDIKNPFLRKVCRSVSTWHYNRSDKLIAMSPALKQSLLSSTNKTDKDIFCIPQYCESFYENAVIDTDLSDRFAGKFKVCFTGNFSPAQGLDVLPVVAKKLKQAGIFDIHFIMVGDGMSYDDFVKLTISEDVSEFFTFEGQKPVTDVPRYLSVADVLYASLSKSNFIGLTVPAKITSYIAAAKPLLLCMDGEGPNLVNDANCGFSAPSGDADQLYCMLMKLYNMPLAERELLGKQGKAYHEKHLKREKILAELLNAILD